MSDLINRSDLLQMIEKDIEVTIDFLKDSDKYSTHNNFDVLYGQLKTLQGYREVIKRYPTVEARTVVRGEWIDTQPDYHHGCGNNAHVCSICGDYYTTDPEDLFFCPRCGADMRGGKND